MKAVRSLAALALMSAAFALPAEAGTLKDDIVAANSGWAADFNSGNAEGVAARYTEDGAVFPPMARAPTDAPPLRRSEGCHRRRPDKCHPHNRRGRGWRRFRL